MNDTQHLNKTTILGPLYLRDINYCFVFVANIGSKAQKLKIFR